MQLWIERDEGSIVMNGFSVGGTTDLEPSIEMARWDEAHVKRPLPTSSHLETRSHRYVWNYGRLPPVSTSQGCDPEIKTFEPNSQAYLFRY
jgi:hypothetical protein